jgi:MFS family permease
MHSTPAMAGLAMLPFALPMFLTPILCTGLARRYSGRTLLTVGLMTAVIGDPLLWALADFSLPYPAFLCAMLVAGAAAGLLNSETAKVMQGAVPAQRAGMAGGLTATTRFAGLLVATAALGAMLAHVASRSFIAGGVAAGLDAEKAAEGGIVGTVPEVLRTSIWQIGSAAFADGFAAAMLLAAAVAATMALFTVLLVRRAETLPVTAGGNRPLASEIRHSHAGESLTSQTASD